MDDGHELTCQFCNSVGEAEEFDGKYYCRNCGEQNLDVVDTATDVGAEAGSAGVYLLNHQRRVNAPINAVPISHFKSQSNLIDKLGLADKIPHPNDPFKVKLENIDASQFDGTNPSIPADFGGSKVASFEDYHNEIRFRYLLGLQMMIELQCEALVREFKVTPLICGLVGPIWLRFVSKTGVFDDDWADQAIHDSEMQQEGEPEEDYNSRAKYKAEPRNMFGQRAVFIWFRSLKKRIPLVCTVVVSYLACHIAREAILPSDMIEWTLEGKLPYFSAFVEIEKRIGLPSIACPISSSFMFRPQRAFSVQKLESSAASIAQFLGLELPPVNFYALAYRYLEKLSLPVEKILPFACRIYEWTMSPDLWLSLSKDYFKLPTHVCVVSILVVAIRILYNINGNGEWEKSLSHNNDSAKDNGEKDTTFAIHDEHGFGNDSANDSVGRQKSELDSTGLLQHLHAIYNEIEDNREYSKDLPTYLKYCRDVVFAGLEPSYGNHEEQNMMDNLWNFYQNEENSKPSELEKQHSNSFNRTGLRDEGSVRRTPKKQKIKRKWFNEPSPDEDICLENDFHESLSNDDSFESLPDDEDSDSNEGDRGSGNSVVKEAIRQLKLDMEENRFCYLPPNVKQKKLDYVHYIRKKDKGALIYVAHADYYILLRACARVAHDDIRILHIGVLSLERRLAWLEKRIHQCLHLKPPKISCQFCSTSATENGSDDVHVPELSNLTI